MTDCTRKIIVILLFWISELRLISSLPLPYCEFDTCNENEYCCGDDECCTKSHNNITVWVFVGLFIVILFFIAIYKNKSCLYRFFSRGSESELLNSKI